MCTASPNEIVDSIHTGKYSEDKEVMQEESATTNKVSDKVLTRDLPAHARACSVLTTNNISLDPKLDVFNVKGTSSWYNTCCNALPTRNMQLPLYIRVLPYLSS